MIYDLQKGSVWKRISAFLFDSILLSILAVGFVFLFSLLTGYDAKTADYESRKQASGRKYGIEMDISSSEFEALSEEQQELYNQAVADFNSDPENLSAFQLVINLSLIITTFGILFSFLALEFVVPILFGNGQTLGKKIFGIALMRTNGVKINHVSLFIRTVLGKFTVETMISVYIIIMLLFGQADWIQLLLLVLIPICSLVIFFVTKNHLLIHDLLADTVVVDYASQMIFESEEEMIAYKTRIHLEEAEKQKEY